MTTRNSLFIPCIAALIVFLVFMSSSSAYKYDEGKVKIQQVTTIGENFDPEWSPDGSTIAYASTERGPNSCVWLTDPDGKNRRLISKPESEYNHFEPTWSPDGAQIAFISSRDCDEFYIYRMASDGSAVTKITPRISDQSIFNPQWSPDGSQIKYDSYSHVTEGHHIWVMDPDGSKIVFERKYLGSWNVFVATLSETLISVPTPSPRPTISVTPEPTSTATPKLQASPTVTPTLEPTPTATVTEVPPIEEGKPSAEYPQTATPTPTPEEPGFDAVFVIAGLLVVAHLVLKRRR